MLIGNEHTTSLIVANSHSEKSRGHVRAPFSSGQLLDHHVAADCSKCFSCSLDLFQSRSTDQLHHVAIRNFADCSALIGSPL